MPYPGQIRAIIETRWKHGVYFDPYTDAPFEHEMYDLDVPRDEREDLCCGRQRSLSLDSLRAATFCMEGEAVHLSGTVSPRSDAREGLHAPGHHGLYCVSQ